MKRYLPINLDVENKKCIIIGGGRVAERKVNSLLMYKAKVTVVSPEITRDLKIKKIEWIKDVYSKKYLDKAFLAIAATNDSAVNTRVFNDCKNKGILINVVDNAKKSNFISPAVLRKSNLVVSVSTDGKSPRIAKKVRDDLKCYRFKS